MRSGKIIEIAVSDPNGSVCSGLRGQKGLPDPGLWTACHGETTNQNPAIMDARAAEAHTDGNLRDLLEANEEPQQAGRTRSIPIH